MFTLKRAVADKDSQCKQMCKEISIYRPGRHDTGESSRREICFLCKIQTNINANSLTESELFHQLPVESNCKIALLCWHKVHMLWQHFKAHQKF